jgi:hypothetical protein
MFFFKLFKQLLQPTSSYRLEALRIVIVERLSGSWTGKPAALQAQ